MSSKCKNKKCNNNGCSRQVDEVYRDDWQILGFDYSGIMRVCKVLMILLVFVISSFYWASTRDILWQCIWSLTLVKLVDLK